MLRSLLDKTPGESFCQRVSILDLVEPKYSLVSENTVSSFESVRRTIEEEFGMPLEEMFLQFDEVPIASASLAQVHIAYDRHGRKYAVKVQHEGLREGSEVRCHSQAHF